MFYWRCSYILFELGIGWKVPFTWYPSNIAKQFHWRTTPMPFSQSQRNEPYACKLCLSPLLFCCWLWRGSSAERVLMHNEYRQCVWLAKRNAMFTSADACEQLVSWSTEHGEQHGEKVRRRSNRGDHIRSLVLDVEIFLRLMTCHAQAVRRMKLTLAVVGQERVGSDG